MHNIISIKNLKTFTAQTFLSSVLSVVGKRFSNFVSTFYGPAKLGEIYLILKDSIRELLEEKDNKNKVTLEYLINIIKFDENKKKITKSDIIELLKNFFHSDEFDDIFNNELTIKENIEKLLEKITKSKSKIDIKELMDDYDYKEQIKNILLKNIEANKQFFLQLICKNPVDGRCGQIFGPVKVKDNSDHGIDKDQLFEIFQQYIKYILDTLEILNDLEEKTESETPDSETPDSEIKP